MIHFLVKDVLKFKNARPAPNGISDTISPSIFIMGHSALDFNNMKIEFGAYAQIFEDRTITNTPAARTIGAIALTSYPDSTGSYPFINLNTGRVIYRRQFTVLPIADHVITRVHDLGVRDKLPTITGGCPLIEWRPGHPVQDADDDREHIVEPLPPDDSARCYSTPSDVSVTSDPDIHPHSKDDSTDISTDEGDDNDSTDDDSFGQDPCAALTFPSSSLDQRSADYYADPRSEDNSNHQEKDYHADPRNADKSYHLKNNEEESSTLATTLVNATTIPRAMTMTSHLTPKSSII